MGAVLLVIWSLFAVIARDEADARPITVIYVDASAAPGGDGSRSAPFTRIGSALDSARATRRDGRSRIEIRIASGEYDDERWPVRVDVPDVSLVGATVLERDPARQLPVAVASGTATTLLVRADAPYAGDPHVIVATADGVAITGLAIDLRVLDPPFGSSLVRLDGGQAAGGHLDRFVVAGNWLSGTQREGDVNVQWGVETHEASGIARGNYAIGLHTGFIFAGGATRVSRISLTGNRAATSDYLAQVHGPTLTSEMRPSAIDFEASGNEADGNSFRTLLGIPSFGAGLAFFVVDELGQPARTRAVVHDNWFNGNTYGLVVNTLGFTGACPSSAGSFSGRFERNDLRGNDRNRALVSSTFWARSVEPTNTWACYQANQTLEVDARDGGLDGCFDWDSPTLDPDTGVDLHNELTVNTSSFVGRRVSPFDPSSACNAGT